MNSKLLLFSEAWQPETWQLASLICSSYVLISELIDCGPDCYWEVGSLVHSLTQMSHLSCWLPALVPQFSGNKLVYLWVFQFISSSVCQFTPTQNYCYTVSLAIFITSGLHNIVGQAWVRQGRAWQVHYTQYGPQTKYTFYNTGTELTSKSMTLWISH